MVKHATYDAHKTAVKIVDTGKLKSNLKKLYTCSKKYWQPQNQYEEMGNFHHLSLLRTFETKLKQKKRKKKKKKTKNNDESHKTNPQYE